MKTIYMYQTEDGMTFTSEDKPTFCDEICCNQGTLRIFRIDPGQLNGDTEIYELFGGEEWKKVPGSDIKLEDPNDPDSRPFHYPKEE
jgi:hypothetical protein